MKIERTKHYYTKEEYSVLDPNRKIDHKKTTNIHKKVNKFKHPILNFINEINEVKKEIIKEQARQEKLKNK